MSRRNKFPGRGGEQIPSPPPQQGPTDSNCQWTIGEEQTIPEARSGRQPCGDCIKGASGWGVAVREAGQGHDSGGQAASSLRSGSSCRRVQIATAKSKGGCVCDQEQGCPASDAVWAACTPLIRPGLVVDFRGGYEWRVISRAKCVSGRGPQK